MDILSDYQNFLAEFFLLLGNQGVEVSLFRLDHIAYYTSSAGEYEDLVDQLKAQDFKHLAENIVGDRRVSLFSTPGPLTFNEQSFSAIEVLEPLPDEITTSRWEHAELISDLTLEQIIEMYPDLNWDLSRMNREEFPMIKLKLSDMIQAKFPRQSALIESIK